MDDLNKIRTKYKMTGLEALEEVKEFSLVYYNEDGEIEDDGKLADSYIKEELLCIEEALKEAEQLKAKAKAFDVLKEKFYIHSYMPNVNVIKTTKELTDKEYEILKKAGVE